MARHEADREDLLAEATALVPRAEWHIAAWPEPVTVGRRRTGAVSIYFGGDPCYHFDADGGLRRAFVSGALYRSEGTTLSRLMRVREAKSSELQRTLLDADGLAAFLRQTQVHLGLFLEAIEQNRVGPSRCVGDDPDVWRAIFRHLRESAANLRLSAALVHRRD